MLSKLVNQSIIDFYHSMSGALCQETDFVRKIDFFSINVPAIY